MSGSALRTRPGRARARTAKTSVRRDCRSSSIASPGSTTGFTMDPLPDGGIANDILAAPAGHPAVRLWIECTRLNYFRSQPQIFGGVEALAQPYIGEQRCALRHVAPMRTGRVRHQVLALLGLTGADLPATHPGVPVGQRGQLDHVRRRAPVHGQRPDDDRVASILARCLTFLRWQLIAREGNLYLSAVAPVIEALPEADAAWTALLRSLAADGRSMVTSVTDTRRRQDGSWDRVILPPEAEAILSRRTSLGRPWFGSSVSPTGDGVWLLDELVVPATLRGADERGQWDAGVVTACAAAAADAVLDVVGRPVGLWIRPDHAARGWRDPARFAYLPPGHVGVCVDKPSDTAVPGPAVHPRTVAALLVEIGAADRPVLVNLPRGTAGDGQRFASELGALLGQPVVSTPDILRLPGTATPGRPAFVPVDYVSCLAMPERRRSGLKGHLSLMSSSRR